MEKCGIVPLILSLVSVLSRTPDGQKIVLMTVRAAPESPRFDANQLTPYAQQTSNTTMIEEITRNDTNL